MGLGLGLGSWSWSWSWDLVLVLVLGQSGGNDPVDQVPPWGNGHGGEEKLSDGEVHGGSPWQQVA